MNTSLIDERPQWKRGLPPRNANPDDYEVYFSPMGIKWYRKLDKKPLLGSEAT